MTSSPTLRHRSTEVDGRVVVYQVRPRRQPVPNWDAFLNEPYPADPELNLDVVRVVRVDPAPPPLRWNDVLAELQAHCERPVTRWRPSTPAPWVWANAMMPGRSHEEFDRMVRGCASYSKRFTPEVKRHERTLVAASIEVQRGYIGTPMGKALYPDEAQRDVIDARFKRTYALVRDRGWDLTAVRRRVELAGAKGGVAAWTLDRLAWMPIIHHLGTMELPES